MSNPTVFKALIITIAVLVGVIVAIATGIMVKLDGASISGAIVKGGIAFGGTVTLIILTLGAAGAL